MLPGRHLAFVATALLLGGCANLDYQSSGARTAGAGADTGAPDEAPTYGSSVQVDCAADPTWAGCQHERKLDPNVVFRRPASP